MPRTSERVSSFTESVIRDMTRLALEHDAINLAQGFPDFACPVELKEAAKAAIDADVNQYAITWGAKGFRQAIAAKTQRTYPGWTVDPETQLTVTCGSTEAMISSCMALLNPGDELGTTQLVSSRDRKMARVTVVAAAIQVSEARRAVV